MDSSAGHSPPPTTPPRLTKYEFLGGIWGGTAVSLIFLLIRLYTRVKGPRRVYWDDALMIFAWALSLTYAVAWQVVVDYLYGLLLVTSGLLWPPPPDFVQRTERYLTGQLVSLISFYTCLYSVKLSFLLFFNRLGRNVDRQRYIWWPITAFTLGTYFVSIGDIQYKCLARPFIEVAAVCSNDESVNYQLVTLKVNAALDVFSDFLIMIIPISLLWNVQMGWRKKFAFMGLFSLVIITMAFAIVRVIAISSLTKQPDLTWLYFWTGIEQSIAILVACLSAFPRLFKQSEKPSKPVFQPSDTYRSMMRRIKDGAGRINPWSELTTFREEARDVERSHTLERVDAKNATGATEESISSQQHILPNKHAKV